MTAIEYSQAFVETLIDNAAKLAELRERVRRGEAVIVSQRRPLRCGKCQGGTFESRFDPVKKRLASFCLTCGAEL